MTDYKLVADALAKGTDPAMLCATCPWDRYCISPPTITRAEVDAEVAKAQEQDQRNLERAKASGKEPALPVGSLMTALIYAGKDTSGQMCPVFALRLRSSKGRDLVDRMKTQMQRWDDQS